MVHVTSVYRHVVAGAAVVLLIGMSACSKPSDHEAASTSPSAPIQTTPQAKTASKLGDLTAFRTIAEDVDATVNKGDLPAAKARIKDLETAWDSAEAGLKPRAADDWHVLDKAIDRALDALRASSPSQADCKAAMTDLLKTFNSLQGQA